MHHDSGAINAWDDGHGVYFHDPVGHRQEITTRPYGSVGTEAGHVHPLLAAPIEPEGQPSYLPDVH